MHAAVSPTTCFVPWMQIIVGEVARNRIGDHDEHSTAGDSTQIPRAMRLRKRKKAYENRTLPGRPSCRCQGWCRGARSSEEQRRCSSELVQLPRLGLDHYSDGPISVSGAERTSARMQTWPFRSWVQLKVSSPSCDCHVNGSCHPCQVAAIWANNSAGESHRSSPCRSCRPRTGPGL